MDIWNPNAHISYNYIYDVICWIADESVHHSQHSILDKIKQLYSIQFNSIQYRHLYAPANEHHVGAHGEETKLQRKIKYMNDKRKNQSTMKKVRFQFCSEGVERKSGIAQVHRERVPHGRRGVVEPSWTQCLCFGSWDVQKSIQARGWAHVGTTGESWSRNALIG